MRQIPREVQSSIDRYVMGLIPLPPAWIEFHKGLAEDMLRALSLYGVKSYHTEMIRDEWFDEMEVLSAIVETEDGYVARIKWDGANQRFLEKDYEMGWVVSNHKDLKLTLEDVTP